VRTAAELDAGTVVGGYRIEGLVGRGGMGVVYRASQLALERVVALKLIAPELAHEPGFRERFLREARLAASLEHPNILPVHEAGEAEGRLFLSMRYVEGQDLAVLIAKETALVPTRAADLVDQVASALDAAHGRGLVHRDVKPQNVLIERRDGREHAYLCDFGLAKAALQGTALTRSGTFLGTLDYASPEQIRGESVEARSDVYALGCLLYRVLTGRVPFPQKDELAKLWAHLHEEPTPPTGVRPGLPAAFDDVLARALAKEPAERYATAGELGQAALAAIRGKRPRGTVLRPRLRRATRRRAILAAVTLAAAGALVATLAATVDFTDGAGDAPGKESPIAEGAAPTESGAVVGAPIEVGEPPSDLVVAEEILLVALSKGDRLKRIDARSGEMLGETDRLDNGNVALVAGDGAIWVANRQGWVGRVDARTGALAERRTLVRGAFDIPPADIAYGFGSAWVLLADGIGQSAVVRIDPETQDVVAEVPSTGRSARALAAGAGAVWVLSDDGVVRIEPGSSAASTNPIRVGEDARDLAADATSVWVTVAGNDTVVRIDPALNEVVGVPIRVGHAPSAIAVADSGVWVTNTDDGTVTRIDPATRSVVGPPIPVGSNPTMLAVTDGSVWVASEGDTVSRIEPGA
jgi:serine/threonine-protein kinase